MSRVTGCLITVDRKAGPVYFLKARDRRGRQVKRKLGPVAAWPRLRAEDRLREWLVDLGRMPDGPDGSITFEAAAWSWLRYVEHEKARKPSTVQDYRNTMTRHLVPHFADRPVGAITSDDVDELRRELLARVSRRTAQKILVLLHGILGHAKRRRWIASNPADDAEKVTVKRRVEFAVLAPADVHAVARAAGDDAQLGALILVAAFTGLRLGELRSLRWRDVDFVNRILRVERAFTRSIEGTPKSGAARSVPLIDQAARALDELSRRDAWTGPNDRVFVRETGDAVSDDAVRDGFYAALERAGIDRDRGTGKLLVWHDLRHSFGCLAVQAFPLSDVQAYMGHANIATTMLYVHHTPQNDAAERLGQLVAAADVGTPGTNLSAPDVISAGPGGV